MNERGGGKIINIGSMMSIFGASFAAPYGASKGGIVQLTKALAAPGRRTTSRSTPCCPAGSTPSSRSSAREQVPGLHERVLARTPAGRWGAPEDMAGIAVFLAAARPTSSPAPPSRSTAATRCRAASEAVYAGSSRFRFIAARAASLRMKSRKPRASSGFFDAFITAAENE